MSFVYRLLKRVMLFAMPPDYDKVPDKEQYMKNNRADGGKPAASFDEVEVVTIPNPPPGPDHYPLKIIYGGLMRMGSLSFAHALARLGFRTHHLLEDGWEVWDDVLRAAEATFPKPGEKPKPFTRKDWDKMLAGYDATTDLAGMFVPQLVAAYPDAKVVVVQRDFEKWWPSMLSEIVEGNFPDSVWKVWAIKVIFGWVVGASAGYAMRRALAGWFRADDLEGIKRNARARYEEHYAWIRENVPKERLLEYRMGDGWEPLAEFLGVEVPQGVPFPRVNDKVEHRKRTTMRLNWLLPQLKRRVLVGLAVPAVVVAISIPLLRVFGLV
ncbi:uncharacterized protein AB675_1704 [Cyphellophora attinorum]|uniref:Uncharacterized protein n=1 Tax=Cyphellophora attinorum TaxID=1664694 RepID=A0A0N1GYS8_9EURO|nr:uncharacterized protein AB675_1704 [Phialophora attinorum]KPI36035.1 hypothetical protein AB675_1704 [Phialophora attinorum]